MDKEFFENRENCSEQTISREEVVKKLASMTEEEGKAEIKSLLDELSVTCEVFQQRMTEISNKHKELVVAGRFGMVMAVSFSGKPIAFGDTGTKSALNDALKQAMFGVMTHED